MEPWVKFFQLMAVLLGVAAVFAGSWGLGWFLAWLHEKWDERRYDK